MEQVRKGGSLGRTWKVEVLLYWALKAITIYYLTEQTGTSKRITSHRRNKRHSIKINKISFLFQKPAGFCLFQIMMTVGAFRKWTQKNRQGVKNTGFSIQLSISMQNAYRWRARNFLIRKANDFCWSFQVMQWRSPVQTELCAYLIHNVMMVCRGQKMTSAELIFDSAFSGCKFYSMQGVLIRLMISDLQHSITRILEEIGA